jgi:hypothetical protein
VSGGQAESADSLIFQTEKQMKEFGDKYQLKEIGIESALASAQGSPKAQDLEAFDMQPMTSIRYFIRLPKKCTVQPAGWSARGLKGFAGAVALALQFRRPWRCWRTVGRFLRNRRRSNRCGSKR